MAATQGSPFRLGPAISPAKNDPRRRSCMSKSKAIVDMPGKGGLATEARDMVSKPLASS
jgi:hypothetical protein